ncbi:MAG: mannose-sensitive agglutinin biosis protein MshI [Rhodocyclales bacterium]|nr:mannose-sensitive agglutinin biosis protein MshI [Rhodocyclales bacterium]
MGFPYIPFVTRRSSKPAFRPGWLVCAQDEHGFRYLHMVHVQGEKPRVLAWENLPAGSDIAQQIRAAAVAGKLRRHRCMAVLNTNEYQIVQAELPTVPDEEIRPALRWTVRELVDYPVDQIGADYLEVPFDKSRGGVSRSAYIVCAKRSVLDRYVDAFESVKARLHVTDVPETAHRNLATLCGAEGKGVALLGVTQDYCLLTFTLDGELCMARRIDVGLRAMLAADSSQRVQQFDRVLLEVQRSLDAFERQFHFAPLSRLLVSPTPDTVDLMPFLVDNQDMKVESLDLSELIDFSAVPELAQPGQLANCLNLLGAGLRSEDAIEVPG